jgi:ribosome recycling factor
LEKELQFFLSQLDKIRSNRISLEAIRGLMIDYQGEKKPIKSLANLRISSSHQLIIQAFEPKLIPLITKTILDNQLGYKVENSTKEEVCFSLSPITREIREKLIKDVRAIVEEGKAAVRRIRQEFRDLIKRDKNISQDQKKNYETQVDKIVKDYQDKIATAEERKIKELSS